MSTDWEGWARSLAEQLEIMLSADPDMPGGGFDEDAADEVLTGFRTWEKSQ